MDVLVSLPLLGLNTVLVRHLPLDDVRLLVLGQETGLGGVIREPDKIRNGNDERDDGQDDHEPLPLVRAVGAVDVRDAEGEEASDDGSEAVALERPADALRRLDTGVEHGHDGHDTTGDASL